MDKKNINTIGKWIIAIVCVGCAAFFANKGNMPAAGGFGVGGAAIIYISALMEAI